MPTDPNLTCISVVSCMDRTNNRFFYRSAWLDAPPAGLDLQLNGDGSEDLEEEP